MNYSIKNSSFKKYIDSIKATIGEEKFASLANSDSLVIPDGSPFLSVIMRTQGNRPEALREAILCLAAQTDTDFELLLMGHNVPEDKRNVIDEIIAENPDWLKSKIRYIPVSGGTRTTPLEQGFENARGAYISIFDDDDIVFDNWVETFHSLYSEQPGTILHAYAVEQDFMTVETHGETALATASAIRNIYCKDFEFVTQLSQNFCPTMSLAFPSYVFSIFGVRFDETLSTTEDWDFLMRCAFICGVSNSQTVTSIYRKWVNAQNSGTLHNKEEWNKNYRAIQNRFLSNVVPVDVHELKPYIYSVDSATLLPDNLKHVELFIDSGLGFVGNKTAKLKFDYNDGRWTAKADELLDFGEIRKIRFDPDDFGILSLDDLSISVISKDGKEIPLKRDYLRSNYVMARKSFVFFGIDPQIVMSLETPAVLKEIKIQFNINRVLSARKTIFACGKFVFAHTLRQACRKAYHIVKQIKR